MTEVRPFNLNHIPRPKKQSHEVSIPEGTVDLEIGCGTGMHSLQYCKDHPHRKLIAIEQTHTKFRKFYNQYKEENLGNLTPLQADARNWIAHNIIVPRIQRCFILYPNPNPKKKLKNQRWHFMPFMHHLKSVLVDKGQLTIATNEKWYFEEALEAYVNYWGFKIVDQAVLNKGHTPRTLFEKKYLSRGEKCYNLVLET